MDRPAVVVQDNERGAQEATLTRLRDLSLEQSKPEPDTTPQFVQELTFRPRGQSLANSAYQRRLDASLRDLPRRRSRSRSPLRQPMVEDEVTQEKISTRAHLRPTVSDARACDLLLPAPPPPPRSPSSSSRRYRVRTPPSLNPTRIRKSYAKTGTYVDRYRPHYSRDSRAEPHHRVSAENQPYNPPPTPIIPTFSRTFRDDQHSHVARGTNRRAAMPRSRKDTVGFPSICIEGGYIQTKNAVPTAQPCTSAANDPKEEPDTKQNSQNGHPWADIPGWSIPNDVGLNQQKQHRTMTQSITDPAMSHSATPWDDSDTADDTDMDDTTTGNTSIPRPQISPVERVPGTPKWSSTIDYYDRSGRPTTVWKRDGEPMFMED